MSGPYKVETNGYGYKYIVGSCGGSSLTLCPPIASADYICDLLNRAYSAGRESMREERDALKRMSELARANADRYMPCPDCRDKVDARTDGCLRCALQKSEKENARLREALEALINLPIISGLSARIRDDAKREGKPNPLAKARAALAPEEKCECAYVTYTDTRVDMHGNCVKCGKPERSGKESELDKFSKPTQK